MINGNSSKLTRRRFCQGALASVSFLACGGSGLLVSAAPFAMQDGKQDFDLLVKGGTVIDPAQKLHAPLDIAVRDGKIVEVSMDIPAGRARQVVSADGKIVTPGLIDIHTHVYDGVGIQGLNPDHFHLPRGSTTIVDAGSAGYLTIAGFRKYIVNASATRVFAMVDIGSLGLVNGINHAMENLENVDAKATAQAVIDNKPATVGVKARLSKVVAGNNDMECLRRTRQAAETSRVPMMIHVGDTYSPLKDILAMLRKGDILTHYLHGEAHGVLDANGKIFPEVLEARQRGVIFDVGHGAGHFSFEIAEKVHQLGFLPDTISSDVTTRTVNGPAYDLPTTLSKFLYVGMSLEDVIRTATIQPAHVFNYGAELGSLRAGVVADIAIFEVRQGQFEFTDSEGKKRTGVQKLIPAGTVRAGKLYKPVAS